MAPKAKGFTNGEKTGRRKRTSNRRVAERSKVNRRNGIVTIQPRKAADYFRVLFDVRAIILGVSLLDMIVVSVGVSRWYEEFGQRPGDFYPNAELNIPILLVLASRCY